MAAMLAAVLPLFPLLAMVPLRTMRVARTAAGLLRRALTLGILGRTLKTTQLLAQRLDIALVRGFLALGFLQ